MVIEDKATERKNSASLNFAAWDGRESLILTITKEDIQFRLNLAWTPSLQLARAIF